MEQFRLARVRQRTFWQMVLSSTTSTWLAFFSPTRELLFLPVSAFAQHRPTEETTAYRKGYQAQQVTKHYRLPSTTGYQAQQAIKHNRSTRTTSYQAQQVIKHSRLSSTTGYQAQQVFFNRTTQTNSGNTTNRTGTTDRTGNKQNRWFSALLCGCPSLPCSSTHTPQQKEEKKKHNKHNRCFFFLALRSCAALCVCCWHTQHIGREIQKNRPGVFFGRYANAPSCLFRARIQTNGRNTTTENKQKEVRCVRTVKKNKVYGLAGTPFSLGVIIDHSSA